MARKTNSSPKATEQVATTVSKTSKTEPNGHTTTNITVTLNKVPPQPSTKTSSRKTKQATPPAEPVREVVREPEPVEEEDLEEDLDKPVSSLIEEVRSGSRRRQMPTRDSVMEAFEDLMVKNDSEIQALKDSKNKSAGIKYLKTLNKTLKTLKNQSSRIMTKKRRQPERKEMEEGENQVEEVVSGFKMPVQVSVEMARFMGADPKEPQTRNLVTRSICDYIKKNNLQDPSDRRYINPDEKLRSLLKYDPKVPIIGKNGPEKGLSYFRLQTFLKPHFIKE